MVPMDSIETMLKATETLRRTMRRGGARQVSAGTERALVKAFALSWFQQHREVVGQSVVAADLESMTRDCGALLEFSERCITRKKYSLVLAKVKESLIAMRQSALQTAASRPSVTRPDFQALTADKRMEDILARRWEETQNCVSHNSPLAAAVMMGALLEATLLARVNALDAREKQQLFGLKVAPRDRKGKPLQLQKWMLNDFIEVAHEKGWIGDASKALSVVIRDYRNVIHPEKELSSGIVVDPREAKVIWTVFQTMVHELVAGA